MYRDECNDKIHGTLMLEGAITDEQIAELAGRMVRHNEYRPDVLALNLNRLSDDWHEMCFDGITIVNYDQPLWGGELDEWPGNVAEFMAAFEVAAAKGWKLPGTLHIEIDADATDGWEGTVEALGDILAAIKRDGVTNVAGIYDTVTLRATDDRTVGRAWITD
jgi:hypothetical protein